MGYTGWAAGGFSPDDYNLTMTPKGSTGSFADQQIVSQCVVGTRNTNGTGLNSTSTTQGNSGSASMAAPTKFAAGETVGTLMAMIALIAIVVV